MKGHAEASVLDGRILVLGATGFVGRWVVHLLEERSGRVVPHARSESRARHVLGGTESLERLACADLLRPKAVRSLMENVRPRVVFNLVGYGVDRSERDDEIAFRINGSLVGDICRAVDRYGDRRGQGPKVIHVGSALEYGEAGGDLSEATEPAPTTLYGRSKLAGTNELRRFSESRGLMALTARLFTVYGPGEHPGRLLPSLLRAAETSTGVDLTDGSQKRDFTYVEDVAEGLLRLADSDAEPGEVVNLATGRLTSVRAFVRTAAEELDLSDEQLRFGARPTRNEEMAHEPVSVERLEELVGWLPPTSVRDGIRKTRCRDRRGTAWNERRDATGRHG